MMDRFISSDEVDAIRKKKQEEWEKKRKADSSLPEQMPEEPTDHRSLAERLQENKDKKQEEYEESHKWKNLIYSGMDDAEFEHVEKVTREKYEQEIARYKQEGEDIKEFRAKQRKTEPQDGEGTVQPAVKLVVGRQKKKADALSALAGAIKRKRTAADASSGASGGASGGSMPSQSSTKQEDSVRTPNNKSDTKAEPDKAKMIAGGLVAYGDSDSDTNSDSAES